MMYVVDVASGNKIEVKVSPIAATDLAGIKKNIQFNFEWHKLKGKEIFKLHALNDEKILGLLCIVDHTDEDINAIEIELLEVGEENVGKSKKLDRIAGILIAFAFRESIKRGHDGYLFLTPKSALITHYQSRYYLSYFNAFKPGGTMVGEETVARRLIKEYLN